MLSMLEIDGRFASDLDYLFAAQYIVESKQMPQITNGVKGLAHSLQHKLESREHA